MTARSWFLVPLLCCAGCAGSGVPVLDAERSLPGPTLLLAPDLRIVVAEGSADTAALSRVLQHELRESLTGYGVEVVDGQGREDLEGLRSEMLEAWRRQRGQGSGRYRAGTRLSLGDAAAGEAVRGTRTVLLGVLYQEGVLVRDDGYVPLPPDYLPTPPEARPDYEVPTTGGGGGGLSLDLFAVDLATGRVIAQRRASYPLPSSDAIPGALEVLAHEVTRGFSQGNAF